MNFSYFLFILFFIINNTLQIDVENEKVCPKINVSTNSSSSKNDIVNNGVVTNIWQKKWEFDF